MLKVKVIAVLAGMILISSGLTAQTSVTGRWADFDFVRESNPHLTGSNPAGLQSLAVDKISVAEINGSIGKGAFINYYQSDDSYTFGARTESFYRISPKAALYGKVGYDNFKGRNMAGSSLIAPYDSPFDMVEEASDDNIGNKRKDTYDLATGISVNVWKGLTLGLGADFCAANYAKHKDLRHTNDLTDLAVRAGAQYEFGRIMTLGANYYYRRRVEGIKWSVMGSGSLRHYSLIDYGSFYGKLEASDDESGYTIEGPRPMFDSYNGASVQLTLSTPGLRLSFFNEASVKSRGGYYGKKAPTSIQYSKHAGDIFEYRGVLTYRGVRDMHVLRLDARRESIDNNRNIFVAENIPGGTFEYVYIGDINVLKRSRLWANVEYAGYFGADGLRSPRTLKAGAGYFERSQTTTIYPYFREQTIYALETYMSVEQKFIRRQNEYSFRLGASYGVGGGNPRTDGTYTQPSSEDTPPASLDTYLYWEYEYLTAARVKCEASLQYSRLLDKGFSLYVAADYGITKAFDIEYLGGSTFNGIALRIGCVF